MNSLFLVLNSKARASIRTATVRERPDAIDTVNFADAEMPFDRRAIGGKM